jgi:hypothetical protein
MCISVDLHQLRHMRLAMTHLHERLEKRAEELWLAAGCPPGKDLEFWNDAEREIVGYTKEEFDRLYQLYENNHSFFFTAPHLLSGSEEQLEALSSWGWDPWSLWTLGYTFGLWEDSYGDPYHAHPFSGFDFSKPRHKRVAKLFRKMQEACAHNSTEI